MVGSAFFLAPPRIVELPSWSAAASAATNADRFTATGPRLDTAASLGLRHLAIWHPVAGKMDEGAWRASKVPDIRKKPLA